MEQYIFAVFWLLLFVYAYMKEKQDKCYYFIAATGSMITNGIAFLLLLHGEKFKFWVKDLLSIGVKFFIILSLFGQLPLIINAVVSINNLMQYAGTKLTWHNKLLQFVNFVSSCFIKPAAGVNTTIYNHISYQLDPVTTLNYLGVILSVTTVLGFVVNYKNRFAQICVNWVAFSFLILCVIGWGTVENGLIIYTLYFAWAYIALNFMLIEKIFSKWKFLRLIAYCVSLAALFCVNLPGIYEIISFGIQHYPVK